jgi:hypothetical protein
MKPEKITVRELCRMVLQKVNEPKTVNEVWDIAVKKGYDQMYDSTAKNPKANVSSYLGTESDSEGEIQRDESNYPYRYSLRYPPIFDEKDDEDAKKHAKKIIDDAIQQAKLIKDNAEQQAKQTVDYAEQQAKLIIDNAKQPADQTVDPDEQGAQQAIDDDEQQAKQIHADTIIEGIKKVTLLIKEQKLSEAEGFNKVELLIERKLSEAEGLRKSAEDDKVKAEELRKLAEAHKIEAERLRRLAEADKELIRGREEVEQSIQKSVTEKKELETRIKNETEKYKVALHDAQKAMNVIYKDDTHPPLRGYKLEIALIGKKNTMEDIQKKIIQETGLYTELREVEIIYVKK